MGDGFDALRASASEVAPEDRWIVMRYDTASTSAGGRRWAEVRRDTAAFSDAEWWPAPNAGDAFRLAVIENEYERLRTTTYKVLPWRGGATFDVGVNVDARSHDVVTSGSTLPGPTFAARPIADAPQA